MKGHLYIRSMRRILAVKILLAACGLYILSSCSNNKIDQLKYHSALPRVKVQLIDTTKYLNTDKIPKGNPIALVYFRPNCKHCQKETSMILQNMQDFEQVRFYFITPMPYPYVKAFYDFYHLGKYKNIVIGRDYDLSLYKYLKPDAIPFVVLYDKNKRLKKVFVGEFKADVLRKSL